MNSNKIDLPKTADFSYIQDIAGGKNDAFFNLLRIIGKNLREYPPQLLEAHIQGKLDDLQKLAHKYKSCTAYLNFPQLDQNLNKLEYEAIEGTSAEERQVLIDQIIVLSDFMEKEVQVEMGK